MGFTFVARRAGSPAASITIAAVNATWNLNSSSSSASTLFRRKSERKRRCRSLSIPSRLDRAQNLGHRGRQFRPGFLFVGELL